MIHTFALFFFSKSFIIIFLVFWTIAKVLFYEISFSNLTFLLPSFTLNAEERDVFLSKLLLHCMRQEKVERPMYIQVIKWRDYY
jgi:hypothetical protein